MLLNCKNISLFNVAVLTGMEEVGWMEDMPVCNKFCISRGHETTSDFTRGHETTSDFNV